MKKIKKVTVVTAEEIDAVWGNANFGDTSRLDIVRYGLLKCASGYYQGHTSTCILRELDLVNSNYRLTPRGKLSLYELFSGKQEDTP